MLLCLFAFYFSLGFLFKDSEASSFLCTGLSTQINITHVNSSTTLLHYQAELQYSIAQPGWEKSDIFYTKLYTYNSSFAGSLLEFYSDGDAKFFPCPSDVGNCSIIFPDGGGYLQLVVDFEGKQDKIILFGDIVYFKGTVFWADGMVLRPDDKCITGQEWASNMPDTKMYLEYCCNRWEELPAAPPTNNTCLEFTSTVEFHNQTTSLAQLNFLYEHFVNQRMNIKGVNFTSILSNPNMTYQHAINYGPFSPCSGTLASPQSNCSVRLIDHESFKDAEFAFFVQVMDSNKPRELSWNAIAGAFEFRNGTLMRNGSDPFTPEKNCIEYPFNQNAVLKGFDPNVSSTGKFCCTKWQNPVAQD
jgi:hypothetical protein